MFITLFIMYKGYMATKTEKKKLPCLKRLPELTNEMVCILKDMQTITIAYKISVTNLEFTLGLTENIFSKDASCSRYTTLLVKDEKKIFPESIRHLSDPQFCIGQKM